MTDAEFRTEMLVQFGELRGEVKAGFEAVRLNCTRQLKACSEAREAMAREVKAVGNGVSHANEEIALLAQLKTRFVRAGFFALKYVVPPIIAALLAIVGIRGTEGKPVISQQAIAQIAAQVEAAMKAGSTERP